MFLVALVGKPTVFGQLKDSPIAFVNRDAITVTFVTAPNLPGSSSDSSATATSSDVQQWMQVEFHYGSTAAMTSRYLDAVTFKIWIEGLDADAPNPGQPGGKGVAVGLTGSVTYINVPVGKDLYGVFYVHPNTLGRYSSGRGTEDWDRKFNIHLEASVDGKIVDNVDRKTDPAGLTWFQALRATPGLVYREDQCAFIVSNPSRYPAIKLPPDSGQ
jgi:hypothetical protein